MDENTLPEVDQGTPADESLPEVPAPAAPETDPGETPEPPEGDGAKPAEKPDGVQRRISELTRKRYEAERNAAYWEGIAKGQKLEAGTSPQGEADAEPQQEKFESYEAYVRAVARWEVSQSLKTERTRIQQETQAQTVQQGFEAQVLAARAKHADFDAVVYNDDLRISPTMRDAMHHSDDGASLAYHLGTHPEEAARIANLPPAAQIMAIGRLQAKLEAKATPAPAPLPSNAPAPITPVKASAPAHTGLREELSTEDWMRRRNAEIRKR